MQKLQCILNVSFKDKRMAVLKPLILLSSIMPTFTIKSINGIARFNFSTIISIALLSTFLSINVVYSSPPALPPPLPNTKDTDQSDETTVDDPDALLKGIDQFMNSRESDTEHTTKPLKDSTNQADSFIDFSNDKLPSLEGEKSNIKTPDLPTNLPKQQESAPTNIVDTQEMKPAKASNTDTASPKLPPLPTPSSGNIVLPEVKAPDNVALPEVKAPTINKERIDKDEITIPTLDLPPQENTKPSFTPVIPHVNIIKPEGSTPVVDVGDTKAPIKTILPNVLDTDQANQTKKDQLKPAVSTPIPVFVQEQTPVEPIAKDITPKKSDENKSTQEEKIAPNKPQKEINIPNSKKALNIPVKTNPVSTTQPVQSPEVIKFAKDETQMVLLPNDDVVLGALTDDARLEQMDMYQFIKIAKQSYDRKSQIKKRHLIENFINSYYNNLHTIKLVPDNVMDTAFESVKKNNLFVLRTFVDNYQILQRRGENNYTLLHEAAESGNYYMAKFLIIRGININAVNCQYKTALGIAEDENNNVSCIIKKALGR